MDQILQPAGRTSGASQYYIHSSLFMEIMRTHNEFPSSDAGSSSCVASLGSETEDSSLRKQLLRHPHCGFSSRKHGHLDQGCFWPLPVTRSPGPTPCLLQVVHIHTTTFTTSVQEDPGCLYIAPLVNVAHLLKREVATSIHNIG